MPDILTKLKYQVEDEGFEPGTPRFEYRLLEVRVQTCRDMQGVLACSECKAFDSCEMTKDYERKKKYEFKGSAR